MARFIHIDVARLREDFENDLDDIYMTYHIHPTNIPRIPITEAEKADQIIGEAMARGLAAGNFRGRGRKKVIFQRDPDFCNGLPRKR